MRRIPLVQALLSLIFNIQMYLAMPIVALIYLPRAIASPLGAAEAAHAYTRWTFWTLRLLCGLRIEVRGTPRTQPVLIAAKHQSFLDVMMIYAAIPRGKFIIKSLLRFAPFFGWYVMRLGCVAVSRGQRGVAIKKMLAGVAAGREMPGQIVIYPQGTRVAPGAHRPYKKGTAALYAELGQPCVPVATNAGVYWPKRGITRHPGVAVVEFLPAIAPGLAAEPFMAQIEAAIEGTSDALAREAQAVRQSQLGGA
jgi:1-acyl-sn-glycerol-3-phosphate acyltransferase